MNDHSSDESELDEASNREHESRWIGDDPQVEDDNQRPQQQRRRVVESFDSQLRNQVIFNNPRFPEILLSVLESENAIQNKLNFRYTDLHILRSTASNQPGANVYSNKRNDSNQSAMKFNHLILSIFHSVTNHDDKSRLVYIMG